MLAEIELLSKQIAALESQAAGLRKQVEALATLARSMEDRAATTQPGAGRP
jgi:prefoldin subunit 5